MKLIREMYDDFEILTEGKNKELKIKGVFMQAETKNRNGRMYPLAILSKEVISTLPFLFTTVSSDSIDIDYNNDRILNS